ncbi:PBAN-type neuropeptides-like [Bacillus rossius redtenbacheri]|uniref:PBAN-type neuropeptides-like n=1 Tax=Bacillus rossius redtenbacheri TaxID=93214 RepID=UPI002FDC7DEA
MASTTTTTIPAALAVLLVHAALLAEGCPGRTVVTADGRRPHEGLWLSPRQARRPHRPAQQDLLLELGPSEEQDEQEVAALLQELPWQILTIPAGAKRDDAGTTYTPRMGRESGEELHVDSSGSISGGNNDEGLFDPRAPPFAPRLGRRAMDEYIPRMGRGAPRRPAPPKP